MLNTEPTYVAVNQHRSKEGAEKKTTVNFMLLAQQLWVVIVEKVILKLLGRNQA